MDGVALVVGEALVDVVEAADGSVVERPGGSAANAAVALSRLLRPVLLATSYGPDARGRLISEHLVASGVLLATEPHVVQHTSVARARIGADGAASYDFDVHWRLGPVAVTDVQVLHVCSLAPLLDPGAEVVAGLVDRLAPTTTVTYDLNVRPAITGTGPEVRERVERIVEARQIGPSVERDVAHPEARRPAGVGRTRQPRDVVPGRQQAVHDGQRAGGVTLDRDRGEQEASHVIAPISTDGHGGDHALHDVWDAIATGHEADEHVVAGLARLDRDPRPLPGTESAHAPELTVDRRRRLVVAAEPFDQVVGRGASRQLDERCFMNFVDVAVDSVLVDELPRSGAVEVLRTLMTMPGPIVMTPSATGR